MIYAHCYYPEQEKKEPLDNLIEGIKEVTEINHPKYYNKGKIEVIDFIEDQQLGFGLGSSVKYICRAGKKNPDKYTEDLKKAIWYLQREVDRNGK
ncbi:MAG: DUF3310 domain-containing protein [Porphyromonadaceae bacterium]|nr:DUF3310 domain-containing protein [Porphyromonadaceae bacterium]